LKRLETIDATHEPGDLKLSNLTDLPNIGTALAGRLEAIGVTTRDELTALGSVDALVKIGAATGSGCYSMLFAIEGAIQGERWHTLPQQVREELKLRLDIARKREPARPSRGDRS